MFWAKDCKYSDQNMQALMIESAVFSMNSKLECRGNFSNWLPTHSRPHWLGSRTKNPQRENERTGERRGRGGAPADTCGPIKTSNSDWESWPRPSAPPCTPIREHKHLHALWHQHLTNLNVHKEQMCTKKRFRIHILWIWDHTRSHSCRVPDRSKTFTAVFVFTWQHFEALNDFSPPWLYGDSVITHQQGEHDESHKLTCVCLQQTKQTAQNRVHMSSNAICLYCYRCGSILYSDPQWPVMPETDQTYNYSYIYWIIHNTHHLSMEIPKLQQSDASTKTHQQDKSV